MMKSVVFAGLMVLVAADAFACATGSSEPFQLISAERTLDNRQPANATITVTIRSNLDQTVRLIDALIIFYDALGHPLGSKTIDRYSAVPAGGTIHQSVFAGPVGQNFELANVHMDDLRAIICTSAVVSDDGTITRFSQ